MLRVALGGIVAALLTMPAFAADQLRFAPPPAWVKTVEPATPEIGGAGPPLRFLLEEHQFNLAPSGNEEYVRQVVQIRTTAGLSEAGSVTLNWNPDIQAITVHQLRVRRGDKAADILATQRFTVLRREAGLESAIVDGALTATIQPEGLEVGDILELAYTTTIADPLMRGHVEHVLGAPEGPVDRYRALAVWDTGRPIAWRPGRSLPKPTVTKAAGKTQVLIDLKDVEMLTAAANAPARFAPSRSLWLSDFGTWADAAAVLAPLYDRASRLSQTSPLQIEIARIRAKSEDPKVRAAEALRLVQDRVRYLAVIMSNGGLDPADADATWSRRYGDCKGKSALLVALLRELGIESEPALVSTVRGDGLDARLPGLGAFDHVIVRVAIDGRTYWLDGARVGDRSLDAVPAPPYRWALPIRAQGAALIALEQPPLENPDLGIFIEVDASGGLDAPAPVRGRLEIGGDDGLKSNLALANIPTAEREKLLREFWSGASWIEVRTVSAQSDEADGRLRILMEGVARPDWQIIHSGPRTWEVTEADFALDDVVQRESGPDADIPYVVTGHPAHLAFKLVMRLPHDGQGFVASGDDVTLRAAGRELSRRTLLEKGELTIETHSRTLANEFPAAEAASARAALQKVASSKVVVQASRDYVATETDVAAWMAWKPSDIDGYLDRAFRLTSAQRYDSAIADYDEALRLDPKAAVVIANRGIAQYWSGRYDKAATDFDAALRIDPRQWIAFHGRALLAMRDRRHEDAVAALTRASDLHPNNVFALSWRSTAYEALGQMDKALVDVDEILSIEPGNTYYLIARGRIHARKGDVGRAAADFATVRRVSANDAGRLNQLCWNQAVANIHLDIALADCQAALALRPDSAASLDSRAFVLLRQGKLRESIADYDAALKLRPKQAASLYGRGLARIRAGLIAEGQTDLAAARAISSAVVDEFTSYGLPPPGAQPTT